MEEASSWLFHIEENNEFGQEWQLLPDAPMLFHEVSGIPQAPYEQCNLPSKKIKAEKKRRLGKARITESPAKVACEKVGVSTKELDSCIYDVMATGDLDMAGSY